ncbi:MAG TPA: hypothetical protein VGR73_11130 [Bryobacteraceae bacterium]|nr:hypothetical protein [Bryobacteraceae bacterium]
MNPHYFRRLILLGCLVIPNAVAQIHPHFGIEAGVPLTDTLMSNSFSSAFLKVDSPVSSSFDRFNSKTKRLLIGPAFRVDLVRGLGLEIDALYQRVNYDQMTISSSPGSFNQTFQQTTANRWQFPLLVQYGFAVSKAKLFVEAGPSISRIANTEIRTTSISSPSTSSTVSTGPGQPTTIAGFTTGAGVDLAWRQLHLRPEFRYSHWFIPASAFPLYGATFGGTISLGASPVIYNSPALPNFNQNEASFLLGLTF